jgi:hypothetical protein
MNTESKHTPGNISVSADGYGGFGEWRFLIAFDVADTCEKAQAVDDCRHLERCWNCHDELVGALEILISGAPGNHWPMVMAVLSKARGETTGLPVVKATGRPITDDELKDFLGE